MLSSVINSSFLHEVFVSIFCFMYCLCCICWNNKELFYSILFYIYIQSIKYTITQIHTRRFMHFRMYLNTSHVHSNVLLHTHARAHTHTHTHTDIHIHTHRQTYTRIPYIYIKNCPFKCACTFTC